MKMMPKKSGRNLQIVEKDWNIESEKERITRYGGFVLVDVYLLGLGISP